LKVNWRFYIFFETINFDLIVFLWAVKDIEALCFDSSRDPTTFFGCCWIIILKRRKRHKMLSLDRALSSYLLPSTTSSFFCFVFFKESRPLPLFWFLPSNKFQILVS
jgi:hypothetical protein